MPEPRRVSLRRLQEPATLEALDRALVLTFPAPRSFTGEDVVEFHLHGGIATLERVLAVLYRQPGCGPAAPGAFTRRAFQNGRLDLTEVEALADLIDAETEAQARQALRLGEGTLASAVTDWRQRTSLLRASVAAELDFSDEGDVAAASWQADALELVDQIRAVLADDRGERLRRGVHVAVVGPPNVGKSSLVNALAKRDVAIVTAEAGTTRDVLEVRLDLKGVPVTVYDTAGLREAQGQIERLGIERAERVALSADLRIELVPPGAESLGRAGRGDLILAGKADELPASALNEVLGRGWIPVSTVDAPGIAGLLGAVEAAVQRLAGDGGSGLWSNARQRGCLTAAAFALSDAGAEPDPVLAAEALRSADEALAQLIGAGAVSDVLDTVFARFCIGK